MTSEPQKLTITVLTDGAAFRQDVACPETQVDVIEVADVLDRIKAQVLDFKTRGTVFDGNGNSCGVWSLS
jgi:hypothetical protein